MRIRLFAVDVRVWQDGKQIGPPSRPACTPPPVAPHWLLGLVLLALAAAGVWQIGIMATVFGFMALAAVVSAVAGLDYWAARPKEKGGTLLALFLVGFLGLMAWVGRVLFASR